VFVHGPGGIGKTALVTGALAGPSTVVVDGREVEPTPARVLAHLGSELGVAAPEPSLDQIADAVANASVTALVIDSYERCSVVDGWFRNRLLPSLPARTTTVLAGRNPPNFAWRTAPGWRHLLVEVRLGHLTEAGAAELVARRGLDGDLAERARRFGRGHPLALELASEALLRHPDLVLADGPPAEVVEELVEVLFDDLDPEVREVVDAASLLRRVTVPTLAAVLGRERAAVEPAWAALRDLPFASVRPDGVELQAVVQDAVATRLELRDPGRARELRRRAARAALSTVARAPGWAATADLLHLVQNPVVRNAFIPPAGAQHPVEAATPADLPATLAITERHVDTVEAQLIGRWWRHHPDGFSVCRGPGGNVAGYSVVVEAGRLAPELLGDDPLAAAMAADLRTRPLRRGGRALLNRQMLSAGRGRRQSPELALMIVDLKRTYLEMRPDLLRVYSVRTAQGPLVPAMHALGFSIVTPLPASDGDGDGRGSRELWVLEMPAGSVDAWIAGHIELETAPDPGATRSARAPAPPPEAVASLSAREREVLTALADGLTNHELAERLFISERTANRHLSNIFTKLGVHNRTAAARVALEAGLAG
jgi:DNA-binding CsgD family transcriptional regulator